MTGECVTGQRLRDARVASGLSQREVAEALGLVRFTLMRWEKGERIPKDVELRVLAEIYQVSPMWFLGEQGEAPTPSLNRKETALRILHRLKNPPQEGRISREGTWVSPMKRERAFAMLRDPDRGVGPMESPDRTLGPSRDSLARIAERIRELLSSRPLLPVLPGVHPEVVMAMRDGLVVPAPELMTALAEKTLVTPGWLLTGEGFSPLDAPGVSDQAE